MLQGWEAEPQITAANQLPWGGREASGCGLGCLLGVGSSQLPPPRLCAALLDWVQSITHKCKGLMREQCGGADITRWDHLLPPLRGQLGKLRPNLVTVVGC